MLARSVLVRELEAAHVAIRTKEALLECREVALQARDKELATALEQVRLLDERYRKLLADNEQLRHRIDRLCRRYFGRSSEQVDPAQLALAFAELSQECTPPSTVPVTEPAAPPSPPEEPAAPRRPRRKGHGRRALPDNLPRHRVEHHPSESERTCGGCQAPMRPIGEETSEQLDYVPASYRVVEHVRVKYACRHCQEGVVIAPPAEKVVEKGLAGPGFLAHVIVSKYADHLPLYRQAEILARQGIKFPESTLLGMVQSGAAVLEPIARQVGVEILRDPVVHADETPAVTKLRPSGTLTGYLFAFTDRQQVIFRFQSGRSGQLALDFFADYRGNVVADEYAGYDALFGEDSGRHRAGCWTHCRRYFYDALSNDPLRASVILALISLLYRVERQAKDLGAEERLALRHAQSRPLVDTIREKLDLFEREVLPKTPVGEAVRYAKNAWAHLLRFLEDGRVPIDNSAVERAIRPVAIGRRNWLAFGSERGGKDAATLYTLLASCKMQEVNPFDYLRDILVRVATHPQRKIGELTPRGWKAARALRTSEPIPANS